MLVECENCQATVDGTVQTSWADQDPDCPIDITYICLKCPRCTSPILVSQADYGLEEPSSTRLFPAQKQLNRSIPLPIRSAYDEALACLRAGAHTASAIMCRKTLEAICSEHGVQERNLLGGLKKLRDQNVIEQRLYEWADALRIAGNEAAHDVKVRVSSEDARDLLDFTNALLEYTFTFRDKFEQFKKRRGARVNPSAP